MKFEEAEEKSLTVKWEIGTCSQGETRQGGQSTVRPVNRIRIHAQGQPGEDQPEATTRNRVQEDVCDGDMLKPLAAEVLIKLLPMAMSRKYISDRALLKADCNKILEHSLALYHDIHENKTSTICDLKSEVSLQTLGLKQRCEDRLEELGGKTQFVVERKLREMANIEAENMSPGEEAEFAEELLTRKPHKLTLCYSSGYGFNANHGTHQGLVVLHETLAE